MSNLGITLEQQKLDYSKIGYILSYKKLILSQITTDANLCSLYQIEWLPCRYSHPMAALTWYKNTISEFHFLQRKSTLTDANKQKCYLFCVGFDLLGGTLLKLEFSFLYGFLSFTCRPLNDWAFEMDARFCAKRNLVACALCKMSSNARRKQVIILRCDFITDVVLLRM